LEQPESEGSLVSSIQLASAAKHRGAVPFSILIHARAPANKKCGFSILSATPSPAPSARLAGMSLRQMSHQRVRLAFENGHEFLMRWGRFIFGQCRRWTRTCLRSLGTKAPKVRRNTRCRKCGDRCQRMKAKIARFDANQTLNIANMAFMNAHFAWPHP